MALCSNCGKQFEDSSAYCPYCGTAFNAPAQQQTETDPNAQQTQGVDPSSNNNGFNNAAPNGYDPNGYNPNGYNPNGYNPNGYNPNGYNPNGYNPYGFQYPPQQPSGKLNVLQLVLSIINILLCCMPLGIAALIYTIVAQGAATLEEETKKLKTAKILNIISIIVGGLIIVAYIVFMVIGIATGELTEETIYY